MNELVQAAAEIQDFMQSRSWRFCFIGGFALLRWGEPRFTQDVDLTLFTGFGDEEKYVEAVLSRFSPRIKDPKEFALENRVLLVWLSGGVPADIAMGGLPFEERMMERSSLFTFPEEQALRTSSAEDLIVMKAFADRTKDWADVETVLVRQAGKLDWRYIRKNLRFLCDAKGNVDILEHLENLRRRTNGQG